jgi:hypothetical protein
LCFDIRRGNGRRRGYLISQGLEHPARGRERTRDSPLRINCVLLARSLEDLCIHGSQNAFKQSADLR